MAVTVRSSSSVTATATGSITGTLPTGWQEGDLLVAFVFSKEIDANPGTTYTWLAETGWTRLTIGSANVPPYLRIAIYWRFAAAGDGNPTFDTGEASINYIACVMLALQHVNAASPIVTQGAYTQDGASPFAVAGLTMSSQSVLLLAYECFTRGGTTTGAPTGFTSVQNPDVGGVGGMEVMVAQMAYTGSNPPALTGFTTSNGGTMLTGQLAVGQRPPRSYALFIE